MSTTTTTALPAEPTTLYYYLEPKDGGQVQTYPGTAAEKRRKHVPHEVEIKDMRSVREDFTLDKSGFELMNFVPMEKDFQDEQKVEESYYPELVGMIKKRRNTTAEAKAAAEGKSETDFVTLNNPARFVHCDQSFRGAEQLLYLNLPEEEADKRMKHRWAIMNVWQPFGKPVSRDPVAFCDYKSLDHKDLRTVVANLPPPGQGQYANVSKNMKHKPKYEYSLNGEQSARYEVSNLAHNPEQQFYFASNMTPEEAWLFKIFDSKKDGRARCAVHSSFPLKDQPEEGEARTSVEVRTFVFWDDEDPE